MPMANNSANDTNMEPSYLITAIGNPNLDVIVKVNDTYIFDKYKIPLEGHLPVDSKFMDNVMDDITKCKYEITYTPGGCAQNSIRVLQWLIKSPFKTIMIGSIGSDKEARFLQDEIAKSRVKSIYTKLPDYRTSVVILLSYQKNRSAIYGFQHGAASMFNKSHLIENNEALQSIRNSKIVHQEAFFTVHSPDVGLEISKICAAHDIITSFNLSGEYVLKKNKDAVLPYINTCDIIIGNILEFYSLFDELKIKHDDLVEAIKKLHAIMNTAKQKQTYKIECMKKYGKILIITNGNKPLYCITNTDGVIEYPIPPIEENLIEDTTGAGDAFLGGFLYGILHDSVISNCLLLGCKMAAEIIQTRGCILPNKDSAIFTTDM